MKTALLKDERLHLTVIKNTPKKVTSRLSINTLYPNFTYQNSCGKIISPKKLIQL